MSSWVLLLLIPLGRFLINLNGWLYLAKAERKHRAYIAGIPEKSDDAAKNLSKEAAAWLTANLVEIKSKVEQAGVDAPVKTYMEFAGYGHVVPQSMNALDNMLFHNREVLAQARQTIAIAAGYYKVQALKSLNPLYWLEVLFFLPRQLVSATGLEVTSKIAEVILKAVQVVYWVAVVSMILFKPELFTSVFGGG